MARTDHFLSQTFIDFCSPDVCRPLGFLIGRLKLTMMSSIKIVIKLSETIQDHRFAYLTLQIGHVFSALAA